MNITVARGCIALFGLLAVPLAQAQSVPVTQGYRDHYYGATMSNEPTLGKPQSKLWWNDGLWWGCLWNPAANRFEIYRFDTAAQTWTATGTAIDNRSSAKPDALWDGQRLYIASQAYTTTPGPTTSSNFARLYRYSYNAASKQYSLEAGFPININSSKSETLTLDKDSTGKLWITWVENNKVMLNRTLGNDQTWGTPFALPVQGNDTDPDDISTLVAFGNKIGVMWSNQKDSTNYFAVHLDGDAEVNWQPREIALSGLGIGKVAEDHLNLKASCDASGNLYTAALTNLSGGQSPSIFILKRSAAGAWSRHVFATSNLNHSRPMLVINDENQRLYVFARSNDTGPGNIYMKSASLSDLVFPTGIGMPIIQSATDVDVTNPTSTKQCANYAAGLLVLAADKGSRYYLHNYIDLASRGPKITSFNPANGPIGTSVTINGSNFTGTTKVTFNGMAASFTIVSNTQLRATVPVPPPGGTTNGKIAITNAFDAGSSAADYLVTAPPTIASFTPADGPVGTLVTITGNNFINATSVAFNGVNAVNFTIDSNTQLRVHVPSGAATSRIGVTNADGTALSPSFFTVTHKPIISSFSPVRAVAGTEITITGSRFVAVTAVSFNEKPATFTRISNTQIRATVPASATTGPIRITNSAGTGVSVSHFIMQYTLALSYVGSGSVTLNPPGGAYDQGTEVTLTATPATGWEFSDWDDDIDGTTTTTTVTMDSDKQITAEFHAIEQFSVTLNLVGPGSVTLDPPNSPLLPPGVYYRDTIVKLTATPAAGHVFSGYSGDFKGWMNVETMTMETNKNLTARFSPLPTPRYANGIWTSAAEVSKLPISGLGWENLQAGADEPMGPPNLADHEDSVNVTVLAKALVYARTGDEAYRQSVISACMQAIGTEQDGLTLSLGRELLAYVLAADLVGIPPTEDVAFRNWLRQTLTEDLDGQTLRSSHELRPNNWGTHCGATRAAIAKYLGDTTELERTAAVFKGWLGDRSTYAGFEYDSNELSWQSNPNAPAGINPLGATIQGHSVDGVLPDDQRRSGRFKWPPPKENYVYGALQGALMQAVILYRAGYDVWNWENQALFRAMKWLYNEANYPPDGDDEWLPHIINHFYKMNFPAQKPFEAPFPADAGKNAGWTDWLYGAKYALTVSDNDHGHIEIHSLGAVNDSLAVMKLTAVPDRGYFFFNWSGDESGAKNPDTLIMNANKSVMANFMKWGPFTVTATVVGSGVVTMNPPNSDSLSSGVYYGGTVVTLTANPNAGFKFISWSGDLTGSINPASLMINSNKNITATFKAVYNLAVDTVGSGTVTLNPPNGPYEVGTVVTLTAKPAGDYQFVEWSGALTGATNPTTITMNADKQVTATFTAIRVVHEETQSGGSSNSTTVMTSATLAGVNGNLYLAAITTRSRVKVNSVSGLGLTWTLVKEQCAGRGNTGVELWMAQGTPDGNGTVTANLASAPSNAALAVSRYSGVAATNPVGEVISGNTKGLNGACSGGIDNTSYSFNLTTTFNGAVVYGAVGMRNSSHAPGTGYTERTEIKLGSGGSAAALAVVDKVFPSAGAAMINGTFSSNVDWAVIAVEIKPPASATLPRDSSDQPAENSGNNLAAFELFANYPNPFNAQTMIQYALAKEMEVRLFIYDIQGRKIRTLVDGVQSAGRNLVQWNGTDDLNRTVGSGVYLIRIEAGAQRLTRRTILLK